MHDQSQDFYRKTVAIRLTREEWLFIESEADFNNRSLTEHVSKMLSCILRAQKRIVENEINNSRKQIKHNQQVHS